ncbi:DUF1971 domain-containing protein [Acidithiobacillus ferrooxidans]|uniref:DUF1971 domain-containing protein n=1 Tax=Acidithiobacillus TaxID=119977 RepID=UPI002148B9D8|nr:MULTISPECIES: DUF1971 domain-containing protein [Acidithiobacillus]MCR1342914.1 DUF1971 domain-containing protein [Acidithiobacillus ferrooxidans]MCR1347113.1 DUF1971 domain-containing protein [Acidithiobacillus ferrooxidans]MCR1348557.1 DUF1971 domain-containing protein [Acidithiobacillus ferrooxidans]MCR1356379.1 DUF1971 domain-containing protein [Acidithiobacillus ferrooxidans]
MRDKRLSLDIGEGGAESPLPEPPVPLKEYQRTPEFTDADTPAGLLHGHRTKAGVWGRIVLLEGNLRYCLEDGSARAWILSPARPAWIPPDLPHRVEFLGPARFYVSFWR